MAKRLTITDLAREAVVSVATVDRLLNGRHPVREETARRIYDTANAIGFHAAGLLRQRMEHDVPPYRLGFILQKPEQHFYASLGEHIAQAVRAARQFRGIFTIDHVAEQTPGAVSAKLRALGGRCQALAVVSVDHPIITSTVAELRDKGIPVFSLLSDFASGVRAGYVGVNNRKAVRTAAWAIARGARQPGKVGVFVGSHRFLGQEMREIGLRSYFRENAPQFEVLDSYVNLEEYRIAYEATFDILQRHPDLVGLYVAGGGMEGAIAALREDGAMRNIVAVCNEITPDSRAALAENIIAMVLATPVARLASELINIMAAAIESPTQEPPGQTFLPFDLYTSENI
jgi:LacI family transcriptional regulator